jgi:hypothetical protein
MNREQILQAISRLNDAIASLNQRLHPPPTEFGVQEELETELQSAQQSLTAMEDLLNNLPQPAPAFAAAAAESMHMAAITQQNDAAIEMSKKVRAQADMLKSLIEPAQSLTTSGGVKKPGRDSTVAEISEAVLDAHATSGVRKRKPGVAGK